MCMVHKVLRHLAHSFVLTSKPHHDVEVCVPCRGSSVLLENEMQVNSVMPCENEANKQIRFNIKVHSHITQHMSHTVYAGRLLDQW